MTDILIYAGGTAALVLFIIICAAAFRKSGNDDTDEMSGTEFEEYAAELLHRNGIEVLEITKGSGGFGADIIAVLEGERTAVQCKRYSRPIGVKAVQEAVAAMPYYKCTRAAVITNSTYTKAAVELAAESGVVLWDKEDVARFEAAISHKNKDIAPTAKTALRFHRLEQGEKCDEPVEIRIGKETCTLPPHRMTIVTAEGECVITMGKGLKKRTIFLSTTGGTRDFAAGYYKKTIFLEEIR